MAMYHLSVKYVSRRKGQSVVAAAAYRSGERLYDERYGQTYDFTKKVGIIHREILLPPDAPRAFSDRAMLWNEVERSEKRCDSRLTREVEIALPSELTTQERIQLAKEYAENSFVKLGMCADVAVHDKGCGNPHAHILLTTHRVQKDGFEVKERGWDKKQNVEHWRKAWADIQNHIYEQKGIKQRVSHESHAARGIAREPTIHLGYLTKELEREGIETERSNRYRAIVTRNKRRVEHKRQQERIYKHQRNQERSR